MTVATSDPSLSLYMHVNVSQYVRPVLVDPLDLQSVADDCQCNFFAFSGAMILKFTPASSVGCFPFVFICLFLKVN
jgi:hypothetical protein